MSIGDLAAAVGIGLTVCALWWYVCECHGQLERSHDHVAHLQREIEEFDRRSRQELANLRAAIKLLAIPAYVPTVEECDRKLKAAEILRSFRPDTPAGIIADAMRDAGLWDESEQYLRLCRECRPADNTGEGPQRM